MAQPGDRLQNLPGAGPYQAADLIRRRSADSIGAGERYAPDFRGRIYACISFPKRQTSKLLETGWVGPYMPPSPLFRLTSFLVQSRVTIGQLPPCHIATALAFSACRARRPTMCGTCMATTVSCSCRSGCRLMPNQGEPVDRQRTIHGLPQFVPSFSGSSISTEIAFSLSVL